LAAEEKSMAGAMESSPATKLPRQPPRNDGRKTQAGLPTQPTFIIFDSFQRLLHLG